MHRITDREAGETRFGSRARSLPCHGGPRDPHAASLSVTMRLKCTMKLHKATPKGVMESDSGPEGFEVAHTFDNYGTRGGSHSRDPHAACSELA